MVFVLFTLSGLVEVFLCAKIKKGSEAYMSGCRLQKLDLKPNIVCARINKKKDLGPKTYLYANQTM